MGTTERLRALLAVRLSNLTDETTSPERQRCVTQEHAERQEWPVVDIAEDLDVSASTVPPFERPQLGPWLREPKCYEWDVLVFWRADRAVRSMTDMFALVRWAQEHRKVIVFVSGPFGGDPMTLDLRQDRTDPHVNILLAIIAFAAEVEALAAKERVSGARAFLLSTDRWAGGAPGYGYLIVKHPVKGKTIKKDEYAAGVIKEIAGWLCDDGGSATAVVQRLNERGELTYRDRIRTLEGKPTRGRRAHSRPDAERELWSRQAIRTIMTSPRLLGYKLHNGKPVPGPDGAPIQIAEPILTHEEFARVQNALDGRSNGPTRTRRTTPLLGVVKCARCGGNASRVTNTYRGHVYQYYRCNSDSVHGNRCRQTTTNAQRITAVLERAFLSQLSDVRVEQREWVKGEDHTAELGHVRRLLNDLENEKRNSTDWDDEDEASYQTSKQHYRKRIKTLKALPQRKAGWATRLTDRTYGQEWESADEDGRRKLMLNAGMTLKIVNKLHYVLTIPTATMRAGYPRWEPHLSPNDIAYIAGDTGATVEVEFTDNAPDSPAPNRVSVGAS
jgi:DNA invertase Pin-like site-specific DNA recombinase